MKASWVTSGRSSKRETRTLVLTKSRLRDPGGFFLAYQNCVRGGLSFLQEFLRDLRQLLADLAGQAIMDAPRLYAGNVRHHHGRGRGHSDNQPYHAEEEKAGQRDQLQHQGVP